MARSRRRCRPLRRPLSRGAALLPSRARPSSALRATGSFRRAHRLVAGPDRRLEALWIGLAQEIIVRQLALQAAEVAFDARVVDDGRAQEDHQLGLAAELAAIGQDLADDRDAAHSGNSGVGLLDDVLHQAGEYAGLAALQAQDRVELPRLEDGHIVLRGE